MKLLIIIFLNLLAFISFSQNNPDSLNKVASEMYEEGKKYDACLIYKDIAENYPDYNKQGDCLYNTAYIYKEIDSTKKAIEWFEKVLNSNLQDTNKTGGKGIFEPYSNYKYYSCFNLAEIAFSEKKYEKALIYYQKSGTLYPYYNSYRTDIQLRRVIRALCISDCYKELSKFNEALITILPLALDSYKGPRYNWVLSFTNDLIKNHFDSTKIKLELKIALESIKTNENPYSFQIVFMTRNIELFPYSLDEYSKSTFVAEIKSGEFWKKIEN